MFIGPSSHPSNTPKWNYFNKNNLKLTPSLPLQASLNWMEAVGADWSTRSWNHEKKCWRRSRRRRLTSERSLIWLRQVTAAAANGLQMHFVFIQMLTGACTSSLYATTHADARCAYTNSTCVEPCVEARDALDPFAGGPQNALRIYTLTQLTTK